MTSVCHAAVNDPPWSTMRLLEVCAGCAGYCAVTCTRCRRVRVTDSGAQESPNQDTGYQIRSELVILLLLVVRFSLHCHGAALRQVLFELCSGRLCGIYNRTILRQCLLFTRSQNKQKRKHKELLHDYTPRQL